jgi:hypothetical protein
MSFRVSSKVMRLICCKRLACRFPHSRKMIQGHVLVGLSCFGAVALLMVHRKPAAYPRLKRRCGPGRSVGNWPVSRPFATFLLCCVDGETIEQEGDNCFGVARCHGLTFHARSDNPVRTIILARSRSSRFFEHQDGRTFNSPPKSMSVATAVHLILPRLPTK